MNGFKHIVISAITRLKQQTVVIPRGGPQPASTLNGLASRSPQHYLCCLRPPTSISASLKMPRCRRQWGQCLFIRTPYRCGLILLVSCSRSMTWMYNYTVSMKRAVNISEYPMAIEVGVSVRVHCFCLP